MDVSTVNLRRGLLLRRKFKFGSIGFTTGLLVGSSLLKAILWFEAIDIECLVDVSTGNLTRGLLSGESSNYSHRVYYWPL